MQGGQFRTEKWVLVTEVGFFNLRAKMKLGVMSNRMFCWGKIERERRRKPHCLPTTCQVLLITSLSNAYSKPIKIGETTVYRHRN